MSECALSFIGDMTDCAVELEQAGAPELDLVAVAGGEAALPVAEDLTLTEESLGVDSDVELGAAASPVVCEGLGRVACVGCPLFQQCLERQRLMEFQEEPKSYLEELLDENGPEVVVARPVTPETVSLSPAEVIEERPLATVLKERSSDETLIDNKQAETRVSADRPVAVEEVGDIVREDGGAVDARYDEMSQAVDCTETVVEQHDFFIVIKEDGNAMLAEEGMMEQATIALPPMEQMPHHQAHEEELIEYYYVDNEPIETTCDEVPDSGVADRPVADNGNDVVIQRDYILPEKLENDSLTDSAALMKPHDVNDLELSAEHEVVMPEERCDDIAMLPRKPAMQQGLVDVLPLLAIPHDIANGEAVRKRGRDFDEMGDCVGTESAPPECQEEPLVVWEEAIAEIAAPYSDAVLQQEDAVAAPVVLQECVLVLPDPTVVDDYMEDAWQESCGEQPIEEDGDSSLSMGYQLAEAIPEGSTVAQGGYNCGYLVDNRPEVEDQTPDDTSMLSVLASGLLGMVAVMIVMTCQQSSRRLVY